jgi:hypothetical protein
MIKLESIVSITSDVVSISEVFLTIFEPKYFSTSSGVV